MSRKSFLNILENVFQPTVNQAMREDLLGSVPKATTLAAETTYTLDFTENAFHTLLMGSANITALNCTVVNGKDSLKVGERVYLKVTNDGTAARTLAFGTGAVNANGLALTAAINAVDLFEGVFDGTNIIWGTLAANIA